MEHYACISRLYLGLSGKHSLALLERGVVGCRWREQLVIARL